jgi:GrpB-like predicted nucleotidyltransferase (UPF0157 family)
MPNQSPQSPGPAPLADEQIRAHTVGDLKPLASLIEVVDYDPHWPELFAREAEKIRAVLGQQALRIEHTGSTSVPGLAAKPIIDMLLVVADSADEDAYGATLETAGYPASRPRAWLVRAPDVQRAGPGD